MCCRRGGESRHRESCGGVTCRQHHADCRQVERPTRGTLAKPAWRQKVALPTLNRLRRGRQRSVLQKLAPEQHLSSGHEQSEQWRSQSLSVEAEAGRQARRDEQIVACGICAGPAAMASSDQPKYRSGWALSSIGRPPSVAWRTGRRGARQAERGASPMSECAATDTHS